MANMHAHHPGHVKRPYRHDTEFETLQFLGKGAFGSVCKVRNKLDGQVYSLKRIRLPTERKRDKILREARLLSSLHHERIQRYFNCWLEDIEVEEESSDDDDAHRTAHPHKKPPQQHQHHTFDSIPLAMDRIELRSDSIFERDAPALEGGRSDRKLRSSLSEGDPLVRVVDLTDPETVASLATMTCSICQSKYIDWEVRMEDWKQLLATLQPLHLCQQCYCAAVSRMGLDLTRISMHIKLPPGCITSDGMRTVAMQPHVSVGTGTSSTHTGRRRQVQTFLFILTEFCEHTLMEVVNAVAPRLDTMPTMSPEEVDKLEHGRGSVYACSHMTASRIWQLFWQIVEGLAYLHTCNIVHRDLKPSNIFASGPDVSTAAIKIGDLGLATTIDPDASLEWPLNPPRGAPSQEEGEEDGDPHHHPAAATTKRFKMGKVGAGRPHPDHAAVGEGVSWIPEGEIVDEDVGVALERGHAHDVHGPGGHERGTLPPVHFVRPRTDGKRSRVDEVEGSRTREAGHTLPHTHAAYFGSIHERRVSEGGGAMDDPSPSSPPSLSYGDMMEAHRATLEAAQASGGEVQHHSHHRTAVGHTRALDTRGVGTWLYMAPEAEHGRYTDKSDVYALGPVLYEMFSRFQTHHERIHMLDALKSGSVPRAFMDAFPIQAQLISNLMQRDPTKRPTASDLLRYRFFSWSPTTTAALPPQCVSGGGVAAAANTPAQAAAIMAGTLHVVGPLSPNHPNVSPGISAAAAAYALPLGIPGQKATALTVGLGHPDAEAVSGVEGACSSASPATAAHPHLHIDIPMGLGSPDPSLQGGGIDPLLAGIRRPDIATASASSLREALHEAFGIMEGQARRIRQLEEQLTNILRHTAT